MGGDKPRDLASFARSDRRAGVEALRRLVAKAARITSSLPNEKQEASTEIFHTLVAPLEANGRMYVVKLSLREAKAGPEPKIKFFDVKVLRKDAAPAVNGVAANGSAARPSPTGATSLSVQRMAEIVNGGTLDGLASKVVDENGEPLVVYHGT